MIEKDIRKLLDIVEEKSVESTQLNENQSNLQDVAEGFSDIVKGVRRSIKGKEHPDVVASKHAGRAIGHYNQGDIAAGNKETKRYEKTRDMHLKAKGVTGGSLKESSIKFGIKKALKEGYWDDIGKAVLNFKGSELPRNYRKLEINSDSPHYKLHADEFKKDVWDQLKDKGVAVAKQIAPAKKVGGVSVTPELLLQIWRKLENVVSNVVPDGDPIDWMAPYIRKMGVDPFYTREILDKAVKRHYDKRSDYSKYLQDMWDAYGDSTGEEDYKNPWK